MCPEMFLLWPSLCGVIVLPYVPHHVPSIAMGLCSFWPSLSMPTWNNSCCSLVLHARILLGLPSSPVTVSCVGFWCHCLHLVCPGATHVSCRDLSPCYQLESRDGHRDHTPSSPKGKLVAAFSQGTRMCGMAVFILLPSIHPPAAVLEWVAISGQQPCSAFSNLTAVGFIRRCFLSLRLLSLSTLSMMLAELQRQNLC